MVGVVAFFFVGKSLVFGVGLKIKGFYLCIEDFSQHLVLVGASSC